MMSTMSINGKNDYVHVTSLAYALCHGLCHMLELELEVVTMVMWL